MIRTHRSSTTAVLIVCLLGTASSEMLFASDDASSSGAGVASLSADSSPTATEDVSTIPASTVLAVKQLPGTTEFVRSMANSSPLMLADSTLTARPLAFAQDEARVFAQRRYGRGYPGRNNGAIAAMAIGAAAAIAGAAVLIYANRPECSTFPTAGGCGYGTKVLGGAVLSGGVVGLTIGALTWR